MNIHRCTWLSIPIFESKTKQKKVNNFYFPQSVNACLVLLLNGGMLDNNNNIVPYKKICR